MENGQEQTRTAIFADLSKEVVAMMMSFWRPIWLISETPEEWFANIALLNLTTGITVQELMSHIEGDSWLPQAEAFDRVQSRLRELAQNRISEVDLQFTLSILRDQLSPPVQYNGIDIAGRGRINRTGTLGNSIGGLYIARWICAIFDPTRLQNSFGTDNEFRQFPPNYSDQVRQVSFLLNSENYQRVRRIYLEDKDRYALTGFSDPEFWSSVARISNHQQIQLTDVYLVNILEFLGHNITDFDFGSLLRNHSIFGNEVVFYNTSLRAPRMMRTTTVTIP
jgi:hypothetical protein